MSVLLFVQCLTSQTETNKRGVIDVSDHEELAEELVALDRRIAELRGARHSLTYDLEQCLLERERVKRHLANDSEEMHGRSS